MRLFSNTLRFAAYAGVAMLGYTAVFPHGSKAVIPLACMTAFAVMNARKHSPQIL